MDKYLPSMWGPGLRGGRGAQKERRHEVSQGTGCERARNDVICLERRRDVGQSMTHEVGQVTSPVPSLLCSPTGWLLACVGAEYLKCVQS